MTLAIAHVRQPAVGERAASYRTKPKVGPDSAETLSAWLSRIGFHGRIAGRLILREELLADPARVLAWWWFALTQEGVTRPVVVVALYLEIGQPPPPHYLALARTWPEVTAAHRIEIEAMLLDGYDCQLLAAAWSGRYPELTAGAFLAMMWLYASQATELGYERAKGAWGKM